MRAGTQVVVALVVAAVLASCRQVVGIGDPQAPPACSRPTSASPSCNACVAERCCAEVEACDGNAACRPVVDCLGKCADDACRDRCEQIAKPSEAAAALLACQTGSCDSQCTGGCGGASVPFHGCKPCAEPCCADATAFRASIDGRRLRACRAACSGDVGCREECTTSHASGADLERAARECVSAACGVSGDWSCVGGVQRERAASRGMVKVDIRLVDTRTLSALAGVTVKGCNADDLTCDGAPFGVTTTDSSGHATISVILDPVNGRDAYSGFIELSRPDYVTQLVYMFPPKAGNFGFIAGMTATSFFHQVEARSGVTLAGDRGVVAVTNLDCGGLARRGISLRMAAPAADARTFYLGSASAGEAAYDFTATTTAEPGIAGVFNIPSGTQKLSLRVDDLCLELGTIEVGVRPGAITYAYALPLP